ncbi:DNRLRE domain-containing protein [Brevibacillus sp. FIR094]|uniref:DNRLRE domain-containing protein n=1 Tax=Brevibacillus sp. FIR094 TaxID=3134809 RepID=UPI003D1F9C3D
MPTIKLDYTNGLAYDGGVTSASPGSNSGGTTTLAFGLIGGGQVNRAYLMFDLGLIPRGAVVMSAVLTLTRTDSLGGLTNLDVVAPAEKWLETVTYNTQPALSNTRLSFVNNHQFSTMSLDISMLVQKWVSAEIPNYGLMLMNKNESESAYFVFASKEHGTISPRPYLTITYNMPSIRNDVYFVAGSSKSLSAVSDFLLPFPTGVQVGDIAFAALKHNSESPTYTITPPDGWATITEVKNNGRMGLFYKRLTNDEILSGNATFKSFSGVSWYGSMSAYRNVKSIGMVKSNSYEMFNSYIAPGDITPTEIGSLLVNINLLATQTNEYTTPFVFNTDFNFSVPGTLQTHRSKSLFAKETVLSAQMTTNFSPSTAGVTTALVLNPIVNEPPTPPTNIAVDKTSYFVGDTIKVSFTPGTDPEGGAVKTQIEQLNPATQEYTNIVDANASPASYMCRPMLDTNGSKIRVRTVDDKGAPSVWISSAPFEVKQKNGVITVPTEVTSGSFYNTSSSPIVRFANGWLGQVVVNAAGTTLSILLSKDGGKKWDFSGDLTATATSPSPGWSIASNGNMLYLLYQPTASNVSILSLDVTKPMPNAPITKTPLQVETVVSAERLSLVFNAYTGNSISYVVSAKVPSYPNSYNIVRGQVMLDVQGHLTPANRKSVLMSMANVSTTNFMGVSHDVSADGNNEFILYKSMTGSGTQVGAAHYDLTNNTWQFRTTELGASEITSLFARYTPNGYVNIFVAQTVSGAVKARFARSSNHGVSWQAHVDLGVCTDVQMAVDNDSVVYAYVANGNTLFLTSSTDGFVTFPASKTVSSELTVPNSNRLSVLREQNFKTKFTVPPLAFRRTNPTNNAQTVSFLGTWKVADPPEVTLTSPNNGVELIEGQTYTFTGSAKSASVGAVIVISGVFGAGAFPLDTFISDGVTPKAFTKTYTYRNKQMFDGNTAVSPILQENKVNAATIQVFDQTNNLYATAQRTYTVKYNMPPVISGTDQDLGAFMQIPTVNYSATDPEANTFTFTEYLNGKQIRSFAGVAGQQYTVEISHDAWIRLDLDVQHQIKIVATDSAGISSERIYTFTRTETHIEFLLEYGNPDMKADFTLDGMPLRVLVTLERYLPEGSSIESVKVCNNYLDDVPTWEDCTNAVKVNRGYLFTNKNKTAPEWAINLWVTINKGTARERVLVNGYGGAFD